MVVQTVRYGGGVSVTEKSDCFLEANIDTLEGETKDIPELAERFTRGKTVRISNKSRIDREVLSVGSTSCRSGEKRKPPR